MNTETEVKATEAKKLDQPNISPAMQAQILAARRRSSATDLVKELNKKFPLTDIIKIDDDGKTTEFVPMYILENFIKTQQTMMTTLLYLNMDLEKKKYYIMDLKLGERYPEEKGKKK